MTAFWCESAFLTGGFAKRVRLVVSAGLFRDVFVDADPEPGDVILEGVTLPGMANTHSHAFHRALRGRVNGGGGNFWNWREQMYQVAAQLNPDTYLALARAVRAVRRGDVTRHREWMIRAYAVAIGISTTRVVGAALDLALSPVGFRPRGLFVLAIAAGWSLTVAAAELWIVGTRASRTPADLAA